MMRNYEMMYILRPDLIDQEVKQIIDKYEDFIKEYGAEEIQITTLGKKRLAYPIKKHQTGIYIQMNYKALGGQVAPLERAMRISEEVLRYLTLCLDEEEIVEVDMRNTNAVVEPILPSNTGNSDGPRKTEPVTLKMILPPPMIVK
ncbi:MAG: 30S ribosomal protein S6 [Synechococcaceae cyanobacterium RL_1_2]|nr:30S ribosomal protein S6 [Synechococcaceae cyanobacterium RL_1_2]